MPMSLPSPILRRLFAALALSATLAGGCGVGHAVFGGTSFNATARKRQSGPIPADIKQIEVVNQCGAVDIAPSDDASCHWNWSLEVRAETSAEAQDGLDAPEFRAETNGDTLRLSMVLPRNNWRRRQFESDFELRVPKAVSILARDQFGPVKIIGVDGPVDAQSESGPVTVRDIRKKVGARTSFSSLRVENIGPASLRDQSGELVAVRVHGPLDVETSFASLEVTDIDAELIARNQSGRIEAARVQGKADLRTSFSSLTAADVHGPLTARNQSGSVSARHIKGDCQLETSFAALEASDTEGNVHVKNQSGEVAVRKARGAITAETSFSSMLIEAAGDSFVCRNQSGPITVRASSATLKEVRATTSFSSLTVQLPANINPSISAHTSFGQVTSDFPAVRKTDPGAADIVLDNQSGNITIRRLED